MLPFDGQPPSESLREQVRVAMRRALQRSGRSVEQIADGLARRLGIHVTHHMLYAWTASSESHLSHRFPLEWTAAFCRETNDTGLAEMLAGELGLRLVDADLVTFAEHTIRAEVHQAEADVARVRALRKGLIP